MDFFFKINKRDSTFIREMRVLLTHYYKCCLEIFPWFSVTSTVRCPQKYFYYMKNQKYGVGLTFISFSAALVFISNRFVEWLLIKRENSNRYLSKIVFWFISMDSIKHENTFLDFAHFNIIDQSIALTKTKYIKLNTKTQIFFNNIRLLYTL